MTKIFNSYKLHIFFISLLSLNYFLPLLIFGKVTFQEEEKEVLTQISLQ